MLPSLDIGLQFSRHPALVLPLPPWPWPRTAAGKPRAASKKWCEGGHFQSKKYHCRFSYLSCRQKHTIYISKTMQEKVWEPLTSLPFLEADSESNWYELTPKTNVQIQFENFLRHTLLHIPSLCPSYVRTMPVLQSYPPPKTVPKFSFIKLVV